MCSPQRNGPKFTKFRLFGSCLFGQGQLASWPLFNHFNTVNGGCSRTRTCDPLIKRQLRIEQNQRRFTQSAICSSLYASMACATGVNRFLIRIAGSWRPADAQNDADGNLVQRGPAGAAIRPIRAIGWALFDASGGKAALRGRAPTLRRQMDHQVQRVQDPCRERVDTQAPRGRIGKDRRHGRQHGTGLALSIGEAGRDVCSAGSGSLAAFPPSGWRR
jgi:hypothetical protein